MQKKYSEIEPGEVFTYAGYEWIKLEDEEKCIMKDILEKRAFDIKSNDWKVSELRAYLNTDFYKDLIDNGAKDDDFIVIETDLTADDGTKDYGTSADFITLITADLYRRNRHLLKPLKSCWWLATPHSCSVSHTYIVRYVLPSGTLSYDSAYTDDYGVRPVIKLVPETLVSVPGEEQEKKTDILESIKEWGKDNRMETIHYSSYICVILAMFGEFAENINEGDTERAEEKLVNMLLMLMFLFPKMGMDVEKSLRQAYEEIRECTIEELAGISLKREE